MTNILLILLILTSPIWSFVVIAFSILAYEWIKDPFFKKAKAEQEAELRRINDNECYNEDVYGVDDYFMINPDFYWGDK